MQATIIRLQPSIATQPMDISRSKALCSAFRAGRYAALYEPKNANPHNADAALSQEWQRGYADGTTEEEKRRRAYSAGKQAALFETKPTCPYDEFRSCEDGLRESWTKGLEDGILITQKLKPDELAWSRGWNAGVYAPDSPNPYGGEFEEMREYWSAGLSAGLGAGAKILKQFGRGAGVAKSNLAGMSVGASK